MTRILLLCVLVACGSSSAQVRYPGAPAAFDRAGADPKALELADKVFAAAGGPGNWDKAKQIRWKQKVTSGAQSLEGEQAWDRWGARHWGSLKRSDGSDATVAYELYGTFQIGFMQRPERQPERLDSDSLQKGVKTARDRFNLDTATLCIQFLLFEPGAKLTYIGPIRDDAGAETADDLQVTYADPLRAGVEVHAIVDRATSMVLRVEFVKIGDNTKSGFKLDGWTTVGGLKFATTRTNLGDANETTTISDIKVSDPEDELWIAPL